MDILVPRYSRKNARWHGWFEVETIIRGKYEKQIADNQLYDLGEQRVLEGFFRGGAIPASFRVGLLKTSYVITETDTMAGVAASELTDAADGGYAARQSLTADAVGWPTSALAGGDWQLTSAQLAWTATGAWADTAGFLFLMSGGVATPADTNGDIIAVAALVPTRQLQAANDIVRVTYNLKLS